MCIASTYNDVEDEYKVYVNGELHSETTAIMNITESVLNIGTSVYPDTTNDADFSGDIYRVQMWDTELSANELAGRCYSGPVEYIYPVITPMPTEGPDGSSE